MMDYARVREMESAGVADRSKSLPHVVLPVTFIVVILLLFVGGFFLVRQSLEINNVQHSINVKRAELRQVNTKIYSLYKEYAYLVSAEHVMSVAKRDGMSHADPSSVIVVHR